MTLFKQIMMFITALLFLVLIIVFRINFNVSKTFVENDLYQRAKNSVNSLSLALGDVSDDPFLMETTINAMFDGGRFQRIALKGADDKLVYEKEESLVIEGVPDFFIRFVDLRAPVAKAVVSNGWNIAGSLEIQSHAGDACLRMWDVFKRLSVSFILLWGGCILASGFMLKILLRSLERIREQAEAIGANQFIINPHMPSTTELRQVVVQMNKMVETVQNNYTRSVETIKEARLLRFRDRVSGLYNKAYFVRQLRANLESREPQSSGEVGLVVVEGIRELKAAQGYEASEAFIKKMAGILKLKVNHVEDRVLTRVKDNEFALILPRISCDGAMEILTSIQREAGKKIDADPLLEASLRAYTSLASYTYEDNTSGIFYKLDYAMTQAKNGGKTSPVHYREKTITGPSGRREWKTLIERTMDENIFEFLCQPVLSSGDETLHREVYLSMTDDLGRAKLAGFFMPMAIELGLAGNIDRYVITQILNYLETKGHHTGMFAINISADFIRNRSCFIWARKFLAANKKLASHLGFEISETVLIRHPEVALDFSGLVRGMGFGFGIDNFTMNENSLDVLRELFPDYIKVDYAYLHDTSDPEKSRITLSMLQNITESLNIKLIGTRIETPSQMEDLNASGILYYQGRQVAGIRPLEKHDG